MSGSDDQKEHQVQTNENQDDKVQEFSELQQIICSVIPPLSNTSHKGQSGRIGVIGGCKEYTGAPYFSSITSLKSGADLSYVFCTHDASPVIKSYSPELIVYPVLDSPNAIEEVSLVLDKLHAIVIGPGLGRNERILANVGGIIEKVKERNIPMVLDADALYFICKCPELIRGYKQAILTPNSAEFDRLYASVYRSEPNKEQDAKSSLQQLCQTLGNITIVRKGHEDLISDGQNVAICNEQGSPRRCGGQGDVLSGALGVFSFWSQKAFADQNQVGLSLQTYGPNIIAALGACMLTRRCSRLAFTKFGRSTTSSDLIGEIKNAFSVLFPVD